MHSDNWTKSCYLQNSCRSLHIINFVDVCFPVSFNLCGAAKKSSHINLDSRTNEEIRTHTKYICVVSTYSSTI